MGCYPYAGEKASAEEDVIVFSKEGHGENTPWTI